MVEDKALFLSWLIKTRTWQSEFCEQLDKMVISFLHFPDSVPQDYRDKQFARHLLWHLQDEDGMLSVIFLRGAMPFDFSNIWIHLMPFIDGRFSEHIRLNDKKLMRFSNKMFEITHDLIVFHITPFEELVEQVAELIQEIRKD